MLHDPLSRIAQATDAAKRILQLQADLFILKQEIKTIRQLQRIFFLGVSLLVLNLFLILGFQWLTMGLHESGWSSFQLAALCWVTFGTLSGIAVTAALYQKTRPELPPHKQAQEGEPNASNLRSK